MKFELTDEKWAKVEPFLRSPTGDRGRPWADDRAVFEGILWLLRTGARWKDIPKGFASPATCWRRLHKWEEEGVWRQAWQAYLGELDAKHLLDWNEAFVDATFFAAKRGASRSDSRAKGKEQSAWWWQTVQEYQSAVYWRARHRAKALSPNERSKLYACLDENVDGLRKFLQD